MPEPKVEGSISVESNPPVKEKAQSLREGAIVKDGMAETTHPLVSDLWQHVGGHLVSVTKVSPERPYSSLNRYVFRESVSELEKMVKQEKARNPVVRKIVSAIEAEQKELAA